MASRRPAISRRTVQRRVAALTGLTVQLRMELRDVTPTVWRRILVPEQITLAKLHGILQAAMGWTNSHLHEYEIARRRYRIPDEEWPGSEPLIDERRVRLKSLIEAGTQRFTYTYDFGDAWEHRIVVEDLVMPRSSATQSVLCIAGENACPPEDVGGSPGYAEFLAAIADPHHEEHDAMISWIGGSFDPAAFNLDHTNQYLKSIKP